MKIPAQAAEQPRSQKAAAALPARRHTEKQALKQSVTAKYPAALSESHVELPLSVIASATAEQRPAGHTLFASILSVETKDRLLTTLNTAVRIPLRQMSEQALPKLTQAEDIPLLTVRETALSSTATDRLQHRVPASADNFKVHSPVAEKLQPGHADYDYVYNYIADIPSLTTTGDVPNSQHPLPDSFIHATQAANANSLDFIAEQASVDISRNLHTAKFLSECDSTETATEPVPNLPFEQTVVLMTEFVEAGVDTIASADNRTVQTAEIVETADIAVTTEAMIVSQAASIDEIRETEKYVEASLLVGPLISRAVMADILATSEAAEQRSNYPELPLTTELSYDEQVITNSLYEGDRLIDDLANRIANRQQDRPDLAAELASLTDTIGQIQHSALFEITTPLADTFIATANFDVLHNSVEFKQLEVACERLLNCLAEDETKDSGHSLALYLIQIGPNHSLSQPVQPLAFANYNGTRESKIFYFDNVRQLARQLMPGWLQRLGQIALTPAT